MMRIEKIPGFPFYVFLIPVFYVWHKMNEYFGLVKLRFGMEFLSKYLIAAVLLLLLFRAITRKWWNAGILATAVLLFLLHWGVFHDWIKGLTGDIFFSSYRFLLPFFVILLLVLLLYLKKKDKIALKISRFLNLLTLLLLCIEAGTSLYASQFAQKTITAHTPKDFDDWKSRTQTTATTLPDIYWIIFDEYASSQALNQFLGFNNFELDSSLTTSGFRVISHSRSNYNLTPYSIASALDLHFLKAESQKTKLEVDDMLLARKSCAQTILPTLLQESGYQISNLGLLDLPGHPAAYGQLFEDMDEGIFLNETFEGRFYKEIWWKFRPYWPFGPDSSARRERKLKPLHINRKNYEDLISEITAESAKPRFIYAHFLMPHKDYLVDRFGNERIPNGSEFISDLSDSLYLDQLIYSNTWIKKIAEKATLNISRPRVVIIQGDHGRRTETLSEKIPILSDEKSYMNLNAIYFSDGDYSSLHDSLSSVNTFRIVLNKYFQTTLPLLPDSTVLILRNAR